MKLFIAVALLFIAVTNAGDPDYVVIGGGISGCTVANRLATYGYDVVLLEQGIDEGTAMSDFPAAVQMRYADVSLLDAPYGHTFRTPRSQLLANRILSFGLGWGLGGGSLVNGAITQRPFRSDYDKWVTDEEMAGWGYDSMLNYHISMESNSQYDYSKGINHQSAALGGFGPIPIRDEIDFDPLVNSGYAADPNNANLYASHIADLLTQTLGIPHLGHGISYAENPIGVGYTQKVAIGGYRVSAAHALIHPLIDPSLPTYNDKLTVLTGAEVVKLDVKGRNNDKLGKVRRVYYMYESEEHSIEAKHEYVLALGAINSPKLLLLSGVGPAADLEALGIEVEIDVPGVGVGLQDHPVTPMVIENDSTDFPNEKVNAQLLATGQADWFGQQGGYMSVAATPMHAYWKSDPTKTDIDTQVLIFDGVPFLSYPINNVMYTVCVDVDSPSRGKVSLRSANHNHDAVVDYAFYYDPTKSIAENLDPYVLPSAAEVHIDCMFAIHDAVSASDKGMYVFAPPMAEQQWAQLKQLRQAIKYTPQFVPAEQQALFNYAMGGIARGMVLPGYHPASTLHMGPDSNPMAPVDGHMRFKTLENLRVVDASVQPIVVSANPMLSIYAVAMKAADLMMKREATKAKPDKITATALCNGWFLIQNEKKDAAGTWFLTASEQGNDPVPDNWFDQGNFFVQENGHIYLKTPVGSESRALYLRVEHEEARSRGFEIDIDGYVGPVMQKINADCTD